MGGAVDPGVEGRRLAIEVIATLVYIKSTMVKLLLRPSGVPQDIYTHCCTSATMQPAVC